MDTVDPDEDGGVWSLSDSSDESYFDFSEIAASTKRPSRYLSQSVPLTFTKYPPSTFADISFLPGRDSPTVARLNPKTNALRAASIPRLIVQLSCHELYDYNQLSDFFLSYRLFIPSHDLLELLMSRFCWAVLHSARDLKVGCAVAMRVFVMIRHWILNFFPDDFVINYRLRTRFADCINKLYEWPLIAHNDGFRRIVETLKRTWVKASCTYWEFPDSYVADFDLTVPIFAGGYFGSEKLSSNNRDSPSNGAARRLTLLKFYDGPIKPVLSSSEITNFRQSSGLLPLAGDAPVTGGIIKGGISLFGDVQVTSILPPTPIKKKVTFASVSPTPGAPSNVRSTTDSWRRPQGRAMSAFVARVAAMMDLSKHVPVPQAPRETTEDKPQLLPCEPDLIDLSEPVAEAEVPAGEVRIDVLSARTIEHLKAYLDQREDAASDHIATTRQRSWSAASDESPTKRQRTGGNSTGAVSQLFTSRSDLATSSRVSMIDSLQIQDRFGNTSSSTGFRSLASAAGDRNDGFDFSSSAGSSKKAPSFLSILSYDSANTMETAIAASSVVDESPSKDADLNPPGLRRWQNHDNLRMIVNFSRPNSQERPDVLPANPRRLTDEIALVTPMTPKKGQSIASTDSPIMTENDIGVAFSGVDPAAAAQLAAIPDDTPEDDEIRASLLKLEGTYVKRKKTRPTHAQSVDLGDRHDESPSGRIRNSAPSAMALTDAVETQSWMSAESRPLSYNSVRTAHRPPSAPGGNHMPFVLSFSSEMLCQQLTLVERDALAEVDWKDVIELKWSTKLDPIQSWLELLVERDCHGVDVAISRFNLMVNWIKSEILLTRDLNERIQAISRFIHIGQQARTIQNYATTMQVVLALESPLLAKLRTTWAKVPKTDKDILHQLTEVVSPVRNFGNLRAELADIRPEVGCIPFIGMYLSDMTFNSERPSYVSAEDGKPADEGLVNFEKFHTASSIVRALIQCVEWSCNYQFKPDNDLLAKCLYIQSLTVEEMDLCLEHITDP